MDYPTLDFSVPNLEFDGRMDKSIYSRDYNVFLRHLRKAREQSGMTQTELGRRLNSTQSFVSKCERGERRLDIVEWGDAKNVVQ